jgi:release factor glutamine methyltransferase
LNLVEYLQKATSYLDRHEVSSPRLNAELLLANLLGITRLDIYTGFERVLSDDESDAYRDLLTRRASGWPLQYLTGEAGFRGLVLEARPGVFIPRPETEILVEKALEVIPQGGAGILDLGCGCGNIAISLAVELPGAKVTAIDCEPAAAELSRRNAARCGVADMVCVLEGDLFEPVKGSGADFDAIVSNPPYVPEGCRDSLPDEVRDYEPPRALFAGVDGLDCIRRITDEAGAYLKPGGWLVLEVDESHSDKVVDLLLVPSPLRGEGPGEVDTIRWEDVSVFNDLTGRPRVVRASLREAGR